MPLEFQSGAIATTHGYQVTCGLLIVVFDPCTRMMNNRGKANLHTQAKRVSHRTRRQHIHKRIRDRTHMLATIGKIRVFYGPGHVSDFPGLSIHQVHIILWGISGHGEILNGGGGAAIPKLATRNGKHPGNTLLDIPHPIRTIHKRQSPRTTIRHHLSTICRCRREF